MNNQIWRKSKDGKFECKKCGQVLDYGGKGYPPILCPNCVRKRSMTNGKTIR